jgi:hypothetical protein
MTDELDIDLMRTKPVEFTSEDNPWLQTLNLNSVSSQRENMTKNNYYRLDLTLGTLKFKLHPNMHDEQILEAKLLDLYYI